MKLEIKTNSGEYVAKFEAYGFDGSQCIIYKVETKSFVLFKVKVLRKVWDSISGKSYRGLIKSSPSVLFAEAKREIDDYERNQKEWEEWRAKK